MYVIEISDEFGKSYVVPACFQREHAVVLAADAGSARKFSTVADARAYGESIDGLIPRGADWDVIPFSSVTSP